MLQNKSHRDDRLKMFSTELDKDLNVADSPFDQVLISVPKKLHYSELMRVMGVCSGKRSAAIRTTSLRS